MILFCLRIKLEFTDLVTPHPNERSGRNLARGAVLAALLGLLLAGCGTLPRGTDSAAGLNSGVVLAAMSMIEVPYRAGGATPAGFDCSGLVYYVYRQAGITVPRSTQEQYRNANPVTMEALQPGDLLFYRLNTREVSHVGIFVGNGRFIHAPSRGKQVSYANMADAYWRQNFVGAGRYAGPPPERPMAFQTVGMVAGQ